jgi:AAA family ATPase
VNAEVIGRIVDLKYLLSTQVIQIQYESRKRLFSVGTVETRTPNNRDPFSTISESLSALSVDDAIHIYIVDWDTTVAIEDNDNSQVSGQISQNVKKFTPSVLSHLTR